MEFRTHREARLQQIEKVLQWRFATAEVTDGGDSRGRVEQLLLGQDDLFCMRVGRMAWRYERRFFMSYPLPHPMWVKRRLAYSYSLHFFHELANCTQAERDKLLREVIVQGLEP